MSSPDSGTEDSRDDDDDVGGGSVPMEQETIDDDAGVEEDQPPVMGEEEEDEEDEEEDSTTTSTTDTDDFRSLPVSPIKGQRTPSPPTTGNGLSCGGIGGSNHRSPNSRHIQLLHHHSSASSTPSGLPASGCADGGAADGMFLDNRSSDQDHNIDQDSWFPNESHRNSRR